MTTSSGAIASCSQVLRHFTERVNRQKELCASLFKLPPASTSLDVRSILGEIDFATHRIQVSDCNDCSVDVCNLEIDVDDVDA